MRKWIFIGVGLFTVLAVLWVLPHLIAVEATKRRIVSKIQAQLHRQVDIRTLRLMFLPGPGFRAEGVTIHEDPSFPGDVFAFAKSVDARFRLLPLLRARVVVAAVYLDSPSVLLSKNAAGVMNVSTLGSSEKDGEPTSENRKKRDGFLRSFALQTLTIRDGQISYSDAATGGPAARVLSFEKIDAEVRNLAFGGTVDIDLTLQKKGKPIRCRFKGNAGPLDENGMPDRAAGTLSIDKNVLKMEATREEGALAILASSEKMSPEDLLSLLPSGSSALPQGLSLTGPLSLRIEMRVEGARLAGRLAANMDRMRISYVGQFEKGEGIPLSLQGRFDGSGKAINISDASAVIQNAKMTASGKFSGEGRPFFTANFSSDPFDLAPWSAMLPAVREKGLSGRVKLSGTFSRESSVSPSVYAVDVTLEEVRARVTGMPRELRDVRGTLHLVPGGVALRSVSLRSGESDLTVSGQIQNFDAPVGHLMIGSDLLKPEDFRPSARAESSPGSERKGGTKGKGDLLSRSAVRADFDLKKVVLPKAALENVRGLLIVDHGKIHIEDLTFNAYNGVIRSKGMADLSGSKPVFDLSTDIEHLPIKGLLQQYTQAGDLLEGSADASLKFKGEGVGWDELSKTLSGGGTLRLRDGMMRRSNLLTESLGLVMNGREAVSRLLGLSQEKMSRDTTFKTWETTLSFSGGKLSLSDIRLVAGDYVMTGSGTVGLDRTLDFRTQVRLGTALGKGLARLPVANFLVDTEGQSVIPMRVTGTLSSPRYLPDTAYIREHAVSHIKERSLNLLKGILPGSGKAPEPTPGHAEPTPRPERAPSLKDLFRGLGQ